MAADSPVLATPPKITQVETHGVEPIPAEERTAGPLDLFRLVFGGANTIATVVLGSFPIIFGLSFRDALLATLLGVIVGAAILAPMALFGPRNGTNNAVSSSAHLGVHGRVVGSFLSLLTAVAFFSISVWTSGDVLVGGANRAIGLPQSDIAVGVAYGIFALLVLTVCIYGFRFMLLVNKIAVVAATLLFLLGILAFGGTFDPGYPGIFGPDADAATNALYWPSFVGAALIVMSNPVSFGAFLGDWARYIPRDTPAWKPMAAAFCAQLATLVPFLFGLVTASVVATNAPQFFDEGNYVGGLLEVSPGWYFLPVCLIALIGGMSTGTTALYGTGLDFSSVFPRFSRVQATVFIGVLAIVFIFIGRFAFNVVQSISTFAVLIVTCTAPWMVVMMIGWVVRRGWYDSDSLQVFNRRQRGGRYWFNHGWNFRGLGAWLASAALSLCFVNLPGQFVGPLGNLADGIDLSIPVGLGVAAVLYPLLLIVFPEPADAFGPAGPRFVRAGAPAQSPIVSEDTPENPVLPEEVTA
ncbi:purine-cytosine permease family protein [Mycolicibacterium diernhoferi]|uniref:Nitrate reductase n=1 Tax=Mycolicibacterium diernhoferi TaxID=1801 RepID=A0A1Q4HHD2_9MYCO|nr:cytosine permease [Mycolicibacterium diernhoferi]OJZ66895.1 nitrate reductase [Mycolicibacterium diernhoferi]OPE50531.1 nitrate reductase [Mycolicibacterium diernhoferi]PEG51970.1 nitrate reductase [Mycolicibacterium diernhoferi]QYL23086.1 cytosine permease [Mycolicibacterium diernhoferi]